MVFITEIAAPARLEVRFDSRDGPGGRLFVDRIAISRGSVTLRGTKMRLAFVGGVHGVGKSNLCTAVAPLVRATHVSAGSLIRQTLKRSIVADKSVADIPGDQEALLNALAGLEHPIVLLDGHFCLLRSDGGVEDIAPPVFARMRPQVLAVITADPDLIARRLYARDGQWHDKRQIETLQRAELAHAARVAELIRAPLVSCDASVTAHAMAGLLQGHL
jgi:adenylate kinase